MGQGITERSEVIQLRQGITEQSEVILIFRLQLSTMKKSLLPFLSFLMNSATNAQTGMGGSGSSASSEISSFKSANMSLNIDPYGVLDRDGKASSLKYADMGGSPFLMDDWKMATIYDINDKKMAVVKTRFNTNSDQIHYLDENEKEWVADKSIIKRVVIQNENNVPTIIEKGFTGTKNNLQPYQFVQILNEGHVQLLKQYINHVVQKDSLFGTIKVNKFSPFAIYYLKTGEHSVIALRKLEQDELFTLLTNNNFIMNYTSKRKKLKTENDFVEFINAYNKN